MNIRRAAEGHRTGEHRRQRRIIEVVNAFGVHVGNKALGKLWEDVLEYAIFQPFTQLFCVIGGVFQQIYRGSQ